MDVMTVRRKTTASSTAGSFASHDRSAPEGALGGVPEGDPVLEAALAEHDIPGLREAWARFDVLSKPEPMSRTRFLTQFYEDFDAGADLERWDIGDPFPVNGQWVVPVEDGYDDNPADGRFFISIPDDRLDEYKALDDTAVARYRHEKELYEDIEKGELPAWRALAQDGERRALHQSLLRYSVRPAVNSKEYTETQALIAKAIETREPVQFRDVTSSALRGPLTLRSKDINEAMLAQDAAVRQHAEAQEMLGEAEQLPPGRLRSMLLDVRPEESYTTTEGTGRKQKKVTRTYAPKSELQKLVSQADRGLAQAHDPDSFGSLPNLVRRMDEHVKLAIAEEEKRAAEEAEKLRKWWGLGWPSEAGECPPVPESYTRRY